jgi:predicted amidohydrolase
MEAVVLQLASSGDPARNRKSIEDAFERLEGGEDLVVLPEAIQMAFGDSDTALAANPETLDGPFVEMLLRLSASGATLAAGMFELVEEGTRPANTTVVCRGGEILGTYRKIHLYDAHGFEESSAITPGPVDPENLLVIEVAGINVGFLTCFDLRFPELAASLSARGADVFALGAAWVPGARKVEQWKTLLSARAIETTAFWLAAAQPGPRYCGGSCIIGPDGAILAEASQSGETQLRVRIDPQAIDVVRSTLPMNSLRRFPL